jgi:hypothetical protein
MERTLPQTVAQGLYDQALVFPEETNNVVPV